MNIKYNEQVHPKKLVELMRAGKSVTQCAAAMSVSRMVLYNWSKDPKKPEFREAWDLGQTLAEAFHEQLLDDLITGELKGNVIGQMYRMKCRWRDRWLETKKMEIEDSRAKQMSDEDLDRQIAILEESDNGR